NTCNHTGLISKLSAWLLYKGSGRYSKITDQRKWSLFSNITGRVLEIGPGAGTNLAYFPDEISWVGLEPNPLMQNYLKKKAGKLGKPIEIITGKAENIPLEDESVDI